MKNDNSQQRSEIYENKSKVQSKVQADIKDLYNLLWINLKNLRKKEEENSQAITEIGMLLIGNIFVSACLFALLSFIVLKG
ncbi:hypothetical protein [Limosilactobacillus mucosae]|uniref:hypothetical protein n=1 Tax=Limosilactobacillus mucosae TaxID=97478 RepID=UPI000FFC7975|nr:hypothetical protein [Limosilactobacillus mucosae]RXA58141.1 hypothetical protein EQ839_02810 [Limosilactobacillus mucosae]